jgi:hypothetical protein
LVASPLSGAGQGFQELARHQLFFCRHAAKKVQHPAFDVVLGVIAKDRQIGENFKVGAGYNFTDFNDDLTELEYDNKGWFLTLSGYY